MLRAFGQSFQQCCKMLRRNVASVWPGLKTSWLASKLWNSERKSISISDQMLSTGLDNTANRYLCAGYIFLPLQVFGRVRVFADLKHVFYGLCPHGSLGNINSPFGATIILLNRKVINIYLRSAFEGRGKSSPNIFTLSKIFLSCYHSFASF